MDQYAGYNGKTESAFLSTGKLYMKVGPGYSFKEFADGKILVEDQLDQIVAYMEKEGKRRL